MSLIPGKLYMCEDYFLMLYPDHVSAVTRPSVRLRTLAQSAIRAHLEADYWTKKFGKLVSYLNQNSMFLVLSVRGEYVEVLVGDKKSWIVNEDFLEIKEINNV